MILVIEGPDGLGKTTFAKQWANDHRCSVFKDVSSPFFGQSVEVSQARDAAIVDTIESIIWQGKTPGYEWDLAFDRWFPSEYAYGKAMGRCINEAAIKSLELKAQRWPNVRWLMCLPTMSRGEWTAEDLLSRGVDDIDFDAWKRVCMYYQKYLTYSAIGWEVRYVNREEFALKEAWA